MLRAYEMLSCSWFYRFRLFVFLVLQIPAFHVPGFTDSGFSCSWFYRFRLFVFLVLQIPAFRVPGFTDSGFSCSWFYRFRLFVFLVLQIPAFRVPGFLVPRSVPRSVPRFPVPCFTDSYMFLTLFDRLFNFHCLLSLVSFCSKLKASSTERFTIQMHSCLR